MNKTVRLFAEDRSGTAGIEFAIMSPVLMFGFVIAADIGLAIHDRMNVEQALRAGAEFAMASVEDPETLEDMVLAAANGSLGNQPGDVVSGQNELNVNVAPRTCACPDAPQTAVSCTTLCTDNIPPSIYYRFDAEKDYAGIFIKNVTLRSSISVQVR